MHQQMLCIAILEEIGDQVHHLRMVDGVDFEVLARSCCSCEHEDPRADDCADAQCRQPPLAERLLQARLRTFGIRDELVDGFAREELIGHRVRSLRCRQKLGVWIKEYHPPFALPDRFYERRMAQCLRLVNASMYRVPAFSLCAWRNRVAPYVSSSVRLSCVLRALPSCVLRVSICLCWPCVLKGVP